MNGFIIIKDRDCWIIFTDWYICMWYPDADLTNIPVLNFGTRHDGGSTLEVRDYET